ncbi:hypothetical protein PSE10B_55900 [Pseudomonas amygdali pv. eriobotryae]|uniref:hypothetical protein n=1 Tax=Pseudomonas amygdali TaxID=47877 RepID=UPI00167B07FA|nr:hypothetical protein [Pseudomonas amygdali]GFZ69068.1 hypothetical protein PSE10B_55900 [Pseudomonas amygdali pv. eriobotryae]
MQDLTRENHDQLDAIEGLAARFGDPVKFSRLVDALVERYPLDSKEEIIRLCVIRPGLIGLQPDTYRALLNAGRRCLQREPAFADRFPMKFHDEQSCGIPHGLWLELYEHALPDPFAVRHGVQKVVDASALHAAEGHPDRPEEDPAFLDAQFLTERQQAGDSAAEAFNALVTHKRFQRGE